MLPGPGATAVFFRPMVGDWTACTVAEDMAVTVIPPPVPDAVPVLLIVPAFTSAWVVV